MLAVEGVREEGGEGFGFGEFAGLGIAGTGCGGVVGG